MLSLERPVCPRMGSDNRLEDGRTACQHDRTARRLSTAVENALPTAPDENPGADATDRAARTLLRPLGAGARGPLRASSSAGGAAGAGPAPLDPRSTVATNTYFGRFHATYWQRWTAVAEVEVDATGQRHRPGAADGLGREQGVAHRRRRGRSGCGRATCGWSRSIDRFVDGGGLWLELTTESGPMTVEDVRWSVAAPRPQRPTSVVICTYNRVDDCLNTLAAHGGRPGAWRVVDVGRRGGPGHDPLESRAAVRRGRRAARPPAALRAPAQPRRRGRVHPRPVRRHGGRSGRRPRRPAHGRRRAARARDPDPAHGVRDVHHASDDRRRPDAQPAAPRAPAHQRRVRRAGDAAGGAPGAGRAQGGVPARARRAASCRRCRTSASTPSTTAGGPA